MRHILLSLCIASFVCTSLVQAESVLWNPLSENNRVIVVHNRVLAKVNGKPITVIDVMRKLDMMFYQRYPEYAESKAARHQFYTIAWRRILDELIDKELMLVEAKELKLEVSNGEVRKEMEKLFGPAVVANLASIGMTYNEAWQMIHGDMVIQRLMYLKVNMKAQKQVTPKEVRLAYEAYLKENQQPNQWVYRVVTVRDADPVQGATTANILRHALVSGQTLETLAGNASTLAGASATAKVTVSEQFSHAENEISENYQTVLAALKPGEYSQPVAQASRTEKSTVFRIFYLKDRVAPEMPSLSAMEGKLRQELVGKAMDAQTESYLQGLRKKHAVSEEQLKQHLPADFEPFVLK